jgi:hypothetical protein
MHDETVCNLKANNLFVHEALQSESMEKKRHKFGIKFPKGKVEEIAFSSSSRSGSVFGLTHSDEHITLINEGDSFSSHATVQSTKKQNHVGRVLKSDLTDKFWLEILRPRKLEDGELDQTMRYLTKKFISVLNTPEDRFLKVTEDKSVSYLDLDAYFEYICSVSRQLISSPDEFLGYCPVRHLLSSKEIECGQLENGRFVAKCEGEIYEMDFSSFRDILYKQENSIFNNPLSALLGSLGVTRFNDSLLERLKEMFPRMSDTVKKQTF